MEFSCNDNGKYILIIIVSNSSLNAEFKYEKEREGNNIKSKLKEIFILFNIMFLIISILCPNISNANDDVVAKIWNALKNEGFSDYAVSGVLGNIYQESKFNPSAIGSGAFYGLCQWGYDRFDRLCTIAAQRGKDWTDLDSQIQLICEELTSGSGFQTVNINGVTYTYDMWKNATSPEDAAEAFLWSFEYRVPAPESSTWLETARKPMARQYYNQFNGIEGDGKTDYTSGNNERDDINSKNSKKQDDPPDLLLFKDGLIHTVNHIIEMAIDFANNTDENGEQIQIQLNLSTILSASNTLTNILMVVSIGVAIIVGSMQGILIMIASAEEKAKIKESFMPFLIGSFISFSAFTIWKLFVMTLEGLTKL